MPDADKSKDGGPAFPIAATHHGTIHVDNEGMTLRDWFAGQALPGVLARVDSDDPYWNAVAQEAYLIADAMLEARKL